MGALAAPAIDDVVDGFIKRVLAMQAAWVVVGEEGLVRAPSPTQNGRMVTLMWSKRGDADRRGVQMALNPRVKPLSLKELYVDVLPKLAELKRLVGPDSTLAVHVEIEPAELARRLRSEAVALFLRKVRGAGSAWILHGPEGPAFVMSKRSLGVQMLLCWHDRASAQARIAGPLRDMVAAEVSLSAFREKMLPWLAESGRLAAPAYCEGAGLLEFAADDLNARLGHPSPAAGPAAEVA